MERACAHCGGRQEGASGCRYPSPASCGGAPENGRKGRIWRCTAGTAVQGSRSGRHGYDAAGAVVYASAMAHDAQKTTCGGQSHGRCMGSGLGGADGSQGPAGSGCDRECGAPGSSAGDRCPASLGGMEQGEAGSHGCSLVSQGDQQIQPMGACRTGASEPGPAVWPPGYRLLLRWSTKETPEDKAPQPLAAVVTGGTAGMARLYCSLDKLACVAFRE